MTRSTKIIATLGPSSDSEAVIHDLMVAGVDVFRLNFSHGTHETHRTTIGRIRAAAEQTGRHIAILQDLSGPKIRTGTLQDHRPLTLAAGDELRIAAGDFVGGPGRVSTSYADLLKVVHAGDSLLLDDGHIQLRVESNDGQELRTVVVDGGSLGEHKGINCPGVTLPSSGLTAKDADDLTFGVGAGVDMVAMSFVQSASDLRQLRSALKEAGKPQLPIVAKLERPEAYLRLDEILQECDAIMVARGDLGLELPLERVPRVQKETTRHAQSFGVPVIIATQVFESMRTEPRPTRAEVSDAANAVDDRVDAIMLAGETAAGAYPVRAVQTLDLVIRDAEGIAAPTAVRLEYSHLLPEHGRALCEAAVTLVDRSDATAIVALTRGGKTARVLAALRPRVPIFAVTDRPEVARRLALCWGVVPELIDLSGDIDTVAARIAQTLVANRAVAASAALVVVSVSPDLARGQSNFLKVQRA
jgi:pyruvate kinase